MYTVCTLRLAAVIDAPMIGVIPGGFVYVALAAWGVTMLGLVRSLVGARRRAQAR
jgi:hypothetical protein